jgi:hypothetical protein
MLAFGALALDPFAGGAVDVPRLLLRVIQVSI